MSDRPECKYCKKKLVMPFGSPRAKVLLVGEFPGKDEIIKGVPFVGKTGDILRIELARAGMNIMTCRLTNLWLHAKDEEGCNKDWHIQQLVKEMKNRTHVLFMGSDLTEVFFDGKSVLDLTGMEVKNSMFPKQRIFVSVNPAYVFHGPVGELRLSLLRFVDAVHSDEK